MEDSASRIGRGRVSKKPAHQVMDETSNSDEPPLIRSFTHPDWHRIAARLKTDIYTHAIASCKG